MDAPKALAVLIFVSLSDGFPYFGCFDSSGCAAAAAADAPTTELLFRREAADDLR